ncbi:PREDICTED: cyclin-dependent protein kinase inhibitor SIM-like [Camelina sativa]|uniref:Cyclin-dependent protein kinase inhibitor SIM-like n=2 Tax=Camelina sativa TaxID=90675 RepID=A0ABM0V801_CAMSA|nr:PREDICTED: cyclin-dependent protein kinase inhibitor SIM-like [Camelina sativa]
MDLGLIQDLPILKFPPAIKIRSNTNIDDDDCGGCTTPTSSDHKIPPTIATTPPPPPHKPRPPSTPSSLRVRSCKRKLMTSLPKYEIIVNKDEIERFFTSVYNQTMTSSTTTTTVATRRRSFRSCSRR